MANAERGEVDLVCGDKTYTLFLSTNALCDMQERTGKTYGQILNGVVTLDIVALREMMRSVLQKHHAKDFQQHTNTKVGELIDSVTMPVAKNAMVDLFKLNTPPEEEAPKEGDGKANPQDAQAGTGDSST